MKGVVSVLIVKGYKLAVQESTGIERALDQLPI